MNEKEAIRGCIEGSPTFTQEDVGCVVRPIESNVLESIRSHVESLTVGPIGQTVIMDIDTCPYTLSEVMDFIAIAQNAFPDHEVFVDGDDYAIVARSRGYSA